MMQVHLETAVLREFECDLFFLLFIWNGCAHKLNKLISVNQAYCQFISKFKPLL